MNDPFGYQSNDNFMPPIDPQNENAKKSATTALVLGILTPVLTCCCAPLALIPGIIAIVFAVKSKKQNNGIMLGKATAGLVLGIIGLVICVISTIIGIVELAVIFSSPEYWQTLEETYRAMGMEVDLSPIYESMQ